MRLPVIASLIFLGALGVETVLEGNLSTPTSVGETRVTAASKKKQIKKRKRPNQPKQTKQRDNPIPPNLGPGIGLGI